VTSNRRWVLARQPDGPVQSGDFRLEETAVPTAPLEPGEIFVRNRLFAVAPTIRNRLKAAAGHRRRGAVAVGGAIPGIAAAEVLASAHAAYTAGDRMVIMSQWEDQSRLRPDTLPVPVFPLTPDMSFEDALGPCSLNSLTAYFGMTDVGRPRAGETVVVSGAAGSVGAVACQIARLMGARVIGIAGGKEKCRWLMDQARIAAAIDYRAGALAEQLADAAPNGIDLFFDNVGGETLQAAVDRMARHGRIVLCGQIAAYDRPGGAPGPADMMRLVYGAIRMEGFVVGDYADRADEGRAQLRRWLDSGELKVRIDRRHGLLSLPQAFVDLFRGANEGTLLVENDR